MPNNVNAADRDKSPEELNLEEEVRIAEHKQAIAEAEYKAAQAKKDAEKLLGPEPANGSKQLTFK